MSNFLKQLDYQNNYSSQEAMAHREAITRCQQEIDEAQLRLLSAKNNYQAYLRGKTPKNLQPLAILESRSVEIKEAIRFAEAFEYLHKLMDKDLKIEKLWKKRKQVFKCWLFVGLCVVFVGRR